ncbi:putative HTH-type transcriptional regulator YfiR [Enhygromyxa salina]|uniref:Putative HTH-type transcriptional regulator YfiR n=1 Tax=Enhygromyxa salina TaxID=215803 RepID=A0A2S9XCH8_9BACT|nr:TetR/AcrR family transcriptional regulator [Enhygromyxa salina]PRP90562.1 putative HTH-type transcriptional regulator YfiR [Enhygromyxa salina]
MTRQRSDEHRKQQIRAAATRCFVRRGFTATRLLDIAREAGLSKGGVYFHYRAKEQIFQDILENLASSLEARWTFDPVTEQPADRTLGQLVKAHLRTMQDEPDEVRLQNLLVSMSVEEPAFRAKLEEITRIMRGLYANVIERGIAEGVFIAGDPNTLAISVLAYINGLGTFTVLDAEGRLPVAPELAAEQVLRMLKAHASASAVEFAAAPTKAPPN